MAVPPGLGQGSWRTHEIERGEGGEGGAMMPQVHALGQHQALRSVQCWLRPSETLLAFVDDIYVVTSK